METEAGPSRGTGLLTSNSQRIRMLEQRQGMMEASMDRSERMLRILMRATGLDLDMEELEDEEEGEEGE